MAKLPYSEGSVFAIPLRSGGYALGVVSRKSKRGNSILCHFFGPRLEHVPEVRDDWEMTASNAVAVARVGDLGLYDRSWPVLGRFENWNRDEWPMPQFVSEDPLTGKLWLVDYDDNDPGARIGRTRIDAWPPRAVRDGLWGSGAAEIKVDKLLGGPKQASGSSPEQVVTTNAELQTPTAPHDASSAFDVSSYPVLAKSIVSLLDALEAISEEFEELHDSEVAEAIHLTLNRFFVWAVEPNPFPVRFGMFSRKADRLVANAIRKFLEAVNATQELAGLPLGQPRHDLLQSDLAESSNGVPFDEFYGHNDTPLNAEPLPSDMFIMREEEEE